MSCGGVAFRANAGKLRIAAADGVGDLGDVVVHCVEVCSVAQRLAGYEAWDRFTAGELRLRRWPPNVWPASTQGPAIAPATVGKLD